MLLNKVPAVFETNFWRLDHKNVSLIADLDFEYCLSTESHDLRDFALDHGDTYQIAQRDVL